MKIFLIVFVTLLSACSSRSTDWDSGSSKQGTYRERQAQEQVEATRLQFQSVGKPQVNSAQPF